MASLWSFLWLLNMFLEDDNLFILILIALWICFTIEAGWLELTLMYIGVALVVRNGL